MPTPAQIEEETRQNAAGRTLHWLQSLEKSDGFTQYLGPKIFDAYDGAVTRIIDAHASGKIPDAKDISTLQGYHEIVTTFRLDKNSAHASVTRTPAPKPTRQA